MPTDAGPSGSARSESTAPQVTPPSSAPPGSAPLPETPPQATPPRSAPSRTSLTRFRPSWFVAPAWFRQAGHGTLAETFTGTDNGIGLIRLVLAFAVVVSHASPVGFGVNDPGAMRQGQSVGGMAVDGFFVLSGFLITRSAMRQGLGRFLWSRALRILPGLWLCLLVTAFVAAPLLAWHLDGGRLPAGFWQGGRSPLHYVTANLWVVVRQYDISHVLGGAVGRGVAHNGAFNGSLWTLVFEVICYLAVGLLAFTAVLRKTPRLVLVVAVLLWLAVFQDLYHAAHSLVAAPSELQYSLDVPFVGQYRSGLDLTWLVYLGLPFALGSTLQLYARRVPVNDLLGLAAVGVFTLSLFVGGYFIFGIPALAYSLLWFSVRAPRPLRKVGRKRDISYGVYIYGFVVEQVLTVYGVAAHGYWVYLPCALLGSALLGLASWYAIERPALRLKGWTPQFRIRDSTALPSVGEPR